MNTAAQQLANVLDAHTRRGGVVLGDSVHAGGMGGSTVGVDGVQGVPVGTRSALGLGLGMALAGRPACVELPSATGLARDVLVDAVRATDFAPTLVVRIAVGDAPGLDDVDVPEGVGVWAVGAATAAGVLERCLQGGVHVILEPRRVYARRAEPVDGASGFIEHRAGEHVTLVAWGDAVQGALSAADKLADQGISAQVVELLQLAPVPPTLGEAVVHTGRLVVAHDDQPALANRVRQSVLDGAFLYLESPMATCGASADQVARAARDSVFY